MLYHEQKVALIPIYVKSVDPVVFHLRKIITSCSTAAIVQGECDGCTGRQSIYVLHGGVPLPDC